MYRYVQLAALFAVIIFMQTACSSAPDFSDVRDKNWKLMEIRAGKNKIIFQRSILTQENFKDIYTLRFDAERVNGIGCPNRYFAPYTLAEKQVIDINTIASTLMLALSEPEQLKERDFFVYLENVYQWNFTAGNLELRSTDNEGATVFLVFALAD